LVDVAADRLRPEVADQAGLFPGFLQGGLRRRLAGVDHPFGDDPAAAVAGVDEADAPVPYRDRGRLPHPSADRTHGMLPSEGGGGVIPPSSWRKARSYKRSSPKNLDPSPILRVGRGPIRSGLRVSPSCPAGLGARTTRPAGRPPAASASLRGSWRRCVGS